MLSTVKSSSGRVLLIYPAAGCLCRPVSVTFLTALSTMLTIDRRTPHARDPATHSARVRGAPNPWGVSTSYIPRSSTSNVRLHFPRDKHQSMPSGRRSFTSGSICLVTNLPQGLPAQQGRARSTWSPVPSGNSLEVDAQAPEETISSSRRRLFHNPSRNIHSADV